MSTKKRFVTLAVLTFVVLVVVGATMQRHGDAGGTQTGGISDYVTATGAPAGTTDVPVSQVGLNQLANEVGHLRISINFTWSSYRLPGALHAGRLRLSRDGIDQSEERRAHDDDEHRRVPRLRSSPTTPDRSRGLVG